MTNEKTIIKENTLLEEISRLICEDYQSGYYPYWQLSFGDFYRSWHINDANKQLIAHSVLLENTGGFVVEKINGTSVQIKWKIEIEKDIE